MVEITYIDPVEGLKTVPASEVPEWVLYDTAEERRKAADDVLNDFNRRLERFEEIEVEDLLYYRSL